MLRMSFFFLLLVLNSLNIFVLMFDYYNIYRFSRKLVIMQNLWNWLFRDPFSPWTLNVDLRSQGDPAEPIPKNRTSKRWLMLYMLMKVCQTFAGLFWLWCSCILINNRFLTDLSTCNLCYPVKQFNVTWSKDKSPVMAFIDPYERSFQTQWINTRSISLIYHPINSHSIQNSTTHFTGVPEFTHMQKSWVAS